MSRMLKWLPSIIGLWVRKLSMMREELANKIEMPMPKRISRLWLARLNKTKLLLHNLLKLCLILSKLTRHLPQQISRSLDANKWYKWRAIICSSKDLMPFSTLLETNFVNQLASHHTKTVLKEIWCIMCKLQSLNRKIESIF